MYSPLTHNKEYLGQDTRQYFYHQALFNPLIYFYLILLEIITQFYTILRYNDT